MYGERIVSLREAVVQFHSRIRADSAWSEAFTRAALVQDTVSAALQAPPGSLFSLVEEVVQDLAAVPPSLVRPWRDALDRLRQAFAEAAPKRD
jgi:hypothetical protein